MSNPNLRFDHFAVPVFDAGRALRFYSEVLGLPLVDAMSGDDWGGKPWLMMIFRAGDGRQVALCALRGAAPAARDTLPSDIRHFAFSVESHAELAAWKQRLDRHDVPYSEEDHGTQRSIYFTDPDGTMLEITVPASTGMRDADPGARALVEAWLGETLNG